MSDIGGEGLQKAFANIRKEHGDNALQVGGYVQKNVDVIPTGAITLDVALGVGGIPRGRITEIFGMESSGKTTLASHIVANAQQMGLITAYIDLEHAYDMAYAEAIGVDPDALIFAQPSSGEEAYSIIKELTKSGEVAVIVVDSVANLVTKKEIEDGKPEIGGIARLMSANLRALVGMAAKTNTAIVFINQIRMKIGVMFGSPEVTPGGYALKFHASTRIRISKAGLISEGSKDSKEAVANKTTAKVIKHKVAPPLKEAEFQIYFGKGIDNYGCLIDLAVRHNIIQKASSYYTIGDAKYAGIAKASAALREDPVLFEEIYRRVIALELPHLAELEEESNGESAGDESSVSD